MAMGLWGKLPYSRRLFLWLAGYSILWVGCVLFYQYQREKEFKAQELNAQLQVVNEWILREGADFRISDFDDLSNLRVSIIDASGQIVYDNSLDSLPHTNHLSREEIAEAIRTGSGYTLRRHSESTGETYFYSARRGEDGIIVRTAVPYSVSLHAFLQADKGFLWFLGGLISIMCVWGFFATRRVGLHEQQEKERIRKQLTNNINHELKTPVASIQVCLETLISHPEMSEEKRAEFLSRCSVNNQRLQKLLSDVALITRMEDGAETITKEKVDLSEIVRNVVEERNEAAIKKGFVIQNELAEPVELKGNASLLESVFFNLIDNALAYSGGNRITICGQACLDHKIAITLSDNGNGVAEEHLPRLFERFYRIDKGRSRAAGGTGLGLSIVKNAVQLHGGTISVSNLPQGGLSFKIVLFTPYNLWR